MEDYNLIKLANNITFIANKRGIRIGQLEDECCLSKGFISRVKRGTNCFNVHQIIRICYFLNMYMDDLWFYDPKQDILDDLKKKEQELEEQISALREEMKEYE